MSTQIKFLSTFGLALALALPAAAAPSPAVTAMLEAGHYAQALRELERASEAGDAGAAEQAGLMHLYGPVFYGAQVPQDLERALRHLVRAARAGSPIARQMVERIGFPLVLSAEAAGETGR